MSKEQEELKAINTLKRLAKRWPKTLWLFSGNGTLYVMRTGKNGERIQDACGLDRNSIVDTIDIPNDGGDW
ncbi:MAG: hypothetical protein PHI12_15125 [Dehalococcoidales bacterium]|jgi:hypothetical protein|nr:hypothetical protein [Dehalococcoidales bacterium]